MLVKLMNGLCIKPDNVDYLTVRGDQVREEGQMKTVFHLALKTSGGETLKVATFDEREAADEASNDCATLINRALGEEPPEGGGAADDDAHSVEESIDWGGSDDLDEDLEGDLAALIGPT